MRRIIIIVSPCRLFTALILCLFFAIMPSLLNTFGMVCTYGGSISGKRHLVMNLLPYLVGSSVLIGLIATIFIKHRPDVLPGITIIIMYNAKLHFQHSTTLRSVNGWHYPLKQVPTRIIPDSFVSKFFWPKSAFFWPWSKYFWPKSEIFLLRCQCSLSKVVCPK